MKIWIFIEAFFTIFLAKKDRNSMADDLTLQFLSTASSLRAGRRDWERDSKSITLVMSSKCLNKLTLTSEYSSLKSKRKICRILSLVAFFPTKGQRERRDSAKAALTCWAVSLDKLPRQGTIFELISESSRSSQNLAILKQAIVLIYIIRAFLWSVLQPQHLG